MSQNVEGIDHQDDIPADQVDLLRLEHALRNSARVISQHPVPVSSIVMAAELRLRRRNRIAQRAAVCGVVSMLAFTGFWIWLNSAAHRLVAGASSPRAGVADSSEVRTADEPIQAMHRNHPHAAEPSAVLPESGPLTLDQVLASTEAVGPFRVFKDAAVPVSDNDPIPILLEVQQADGQVVFAPGLIVPERTERMNWSQLNSDERRAVRQVLELEADPAQSDQPVI